MDLLHHDGERCGTSLNEVKGVGGMSGFATPFAMLRAVPPEHLPHHDG
jgi:hypothetical protein